MEGYWPIFYLLVILKIPVLGMIWLVWWAMQEKEDPTTAEDGGGTDRIRPVEPRGPRRPRRDPHGGAMLHPVPAASRRYRDGDTAQADAVRERARARERSRSAESNRR